MYLKIYAITYKYKIYKSVTMDSKFITPKNVPVTTVDA